jgi:hypothetical protein
MKCTKYTAGFFSSSIPGVAQNWRPTELANEQCSRPEADRRFDTLVKAMTQHEQVDELTVASVFIRNESTGEYIRSMTADGTEAEAKSTDRAFVFCGGHAVGSA